MLSGAIKVVRSGAPAYTLYVCVQERTSALLREAATADYCPYKMQIELPCLAHSLSRA